MNTKLITSTKFNISGLNVVKSINYTDNRVFINENRFFDGISEDVWAQRREIEEPRVCPKCKSLYWNRPYGDCNALSGRKKYLLLRL